PIASASAAQDTRSMSLRTIPSTSAGSSPASASAASVASAASAVTLTPEFFEYSVSPIPTIAQASRCQPSDTGQHLVGVLTEQRRPRGRAVAVGEPVGQTGEGGGAAVGEFDVDEEVPGLEVFVLQHLLGCAQRPDGQTPALTVPIHRLGILQHEERFEQPLDVGEVRLPVSQREILLLDEVGGDSDLIHPRRQRIPRVLV